MALTLTLTLTPTPTLTPALPLTLARSMRVFKAYLESDGANLAVTPELLTPNPLTLNLTLTVSLTR